MDALFGDADDAERRWDESVDALDFGDDFASRVTRGAPEIEPSSVSDVFGSSSDEEGEGAMGPPSVAQHEHEVGLDRSRIKPLALSEELDDGLAALGQLGVEAFDNSELERGYLEQLQRAATEAASAKAAQKKSATELPSVSANKKASARPKSKATAASAKRGRQRTEVALELGEARTEEQQLLNQGLITPFGSKLSDIEIHERTERKDDDDDDDDDGRVKDDPIDVEALDDADDEDEEDLHSVAKEQKQSAQGAATSSGGKKRTRGGKVERRDEDEDPDALYDEEDGAESESASALEEEEEEDDGELQALWVDDAVDAAYARRLAQWRRLSEEADAAQLGDFTQQPQTRWVDAGEEAHEAYAQFPGGYRLPQRLYARLFDHQKTGVRWLWELHQQQAGGIVADEMGLGKTLTSVAFLAGLHYSRLLTGPVLVVCPATVLAQWVREFHAWWPALRVSLLHGTGSWPGSASALVARAVRSGREVVVTTYEAVRAAASSAALTSAPWAYVVLDEGHRLRNPAAHTTQVCKLFATPHRLLLTGAPIQNSLQELWSLVDFVFPGKLGTLAAFQLQFGEPIARGGYAHASAVEVQTAYQCALVLRDLVTPYLLRRQKKDVQLTLPEKREHVLFCALTDAQRDAYVRFLRSADCARILAGKHKALYGIGVLRKICNHPALLEAAPWRYSADFARQSAKLRVLGELLPQWAAQGHRALVFTQSVQMLDVLDAFVAHQQPPLPYRRMDGSTPVAQRQRLIDEFNADTRIKVFILTTRTGGVGVNLTGADRVLIIDPDWNPSTDHQARERAYRIGQQRAVRVYRLITSGGIEEKIYHRQLYKNFLTLKVLQNPKQTKTLFHAKSLADLFRLDARTTAHDAPETAQLYAPHLALHTQDEGERTHTHTHTQDEREKPRQRGQEDAAKKSADDDGDERDEYEERPRKRARMEVHEDEHGLLKELMGSALATIVDHDKLEAFEGRAPNQRFTYAVRRDAEQLALRAAANLRQSRAAEPALTLPSAKPRFGGVQRSASSSALSRSSSSGIGASSSSSSTVNSISNSGVGSAGIQGGGARALSSQTLAQALNPVAARQAQHSSLAQQIVAFFAARGFSSPSQAVVQHFKSALPAAELLVFKKLLQQLAAFDGATWTLRDEYRKS